MWHRTSFSATAAGAEALDPRRFVDLQGLKACADMSNSFVHTELIQEKPALMAFYKRLTEQAYPSGRSEKWAK
jgi:hypothetical protein